MRDFSLKNGGKNSEIFGFFILARCAPERANAQRADSEAPGTRVSADQFAAEDGDGLPGKQNAFATDGNAHDAASG